MDELSKSTKWVPTYIEIDRIKKEALKLGEQKGRKEGIIKVAKKMKKDGVDLYQIKKFTGLSKKDIEEL